MKVMIIQKTNLLHLMSIIFAATIGLSFAIPVSVYGQDGLSMIQKTPTLRFQPVDGEGGKRGSKSIFRVPSFTSCPNGYKIDEFGECHRILYVNEEVWLNQVLNNLHAVFGIVAKTSSTKPISLEHVRIHSYSLNEMRKNQYEEDEIPLKIEIPVDTVNFKRSE